MGNTVKQTTVHGQTDNEAFCYDALNLLIWAGSTGTPSCGTSLTTGTLTAAQYTQTYGYDTSWRLTQGRSGNGYNVWGQRASASGDEYGKGLHGGE